jgi:NAD(P) transhydrogenase subunit alpha
MPTVFVPKETRSGETRVAATPATVKRMVKEGLSVTLEAGAGLLAHFSDAEFTKAGATIAPDRAQSWSTADVVLHVNVPRAEDLSLMKEGASIISFLWAHENLDLVKLLAERKISCFAMDLLPRITRAQKDDALSSQANLAGYKAAVVAAYHLGKIMPMMMTPSGTIRPAKVVVVGAGVAGLQAIATAKRLGANVEVSDVRPEVKEQAESLGATYIEVEGAEGYSTESGYAREQTEEDRRRQQETLHKHVAAADAVITTALIPYRPAPKIITEAMLKDMRPGSVVVDLAAERGGNCDGTVAGEIVTREGVTLVGCVKLEDTVPVNASEMYGMNMYNILKDYVKDGQLVWDLEDEIVDGAMATHGGEVHHPKVREAMGLPPKEPPPEEKKEEAAEEKPGGGEKEATS